MTEWRRLDVFKPGLVLLTLVGPRAAAAQQTLDVKAFYLRTCAVCHGPDGSARLPSGQRLPGRPLNDPKWQAKQKDEDLVKVILKGQAAMPGFQGQVSEAEAKRIVAEVVRPLAGKRK